MWYVISSSRGVWFGLLVDLVASWLHFLCGLSVDYGCALRGLLRYGFWFFSCLVVCFAGCVVAVVAFCWFGRLMVLLV